MNLTNILIVFLGSGFGGALRYAVSHMVQSNVPGCLFPWGTFVVNVVGCLLIGVIYGLVDKGSFLSPELRLLATVGFCGGFTTFSTFIHENYLLFGSSNLAVVGAYLALSVTIGFGCAYLGHALVR